MALTRATADRQHGNSDCEDGDLHGGVQEALEVSGCGVRCRSVSVWGHQVAFYMIQEAHKRRGAGTGYHLGYCSIYFVIFSVE